MNKCITLVTSFLLLVRAFGFAQENHHSDGAEEILKHLAQAYEDDRTVEQIKKDNGLIRAAGDGDSEAIRNALKDGALINSRYIDGYAFMSAGQSGYTALMFAVIKKQTGAIKLLIENNADLEVKHHKGWTALDLAVVGNYNEAIEMLVKAGAKQNPTKIRLARDLIKAACKGFEPRPNEPFPPYPGAPTGDTSQHPDILEVLKRGADVNMTDPLGYTAVMYAANLGLVENVKTLLANGADATLKSTTGETALSLAEREDPLFRLEKRRQVVKLLKAHLAKKR